MARSMAKLTIARMKPMTTRRTVKLPVLRNLDRLGDESANDLYGIKSRARPRSVQRPENMWTMSGADWPAVMTSE